MVLRTDRARPAGVLLRQPRVAARHQLKRNASVSSTQRSWPSFVRTHTRFPFSSAPDDRTIDEWAALLRAADLVGQLGEKGQCALLRIRGNWLEQAAWLRIRRRTWSTNIRNSTGTGCLRTFRTPSDT